MTATHPPTFDLNAANGTFTGDLTVDTNTLYVDSTNNRVGVGTSSPNQKLHVYDSSTNATHIRTTNSNGDIFYGLDANGAGYAWMNSGSGSFYVGTSGAGDLIAYAGSAERMRITSAGGVGIGTTSVGYKMTIFENGNNFLQFSSTGDAVAGHLIGRAASKNLRVQNSENADTEFWTNNTERMRIDSSGRVGIGTTSHYDTSTKLTVAGRINTSNGTAIGSMNYGNGTVINIGSLSNHPLQFMTNNTTRATIDSSGNLLVGTTSTSFSTAGTVLYGSDGVQIVRDGATALNLNRKTSDGSILGFFKDGSTVGSIGSRVGVVSYIALDPRTSGVNGAGLTGGSVSSTIGEILPTNGSGAVDDGAVNLGDPSYRFKNLWLSGGVYLGGTGSANLLHYYEEGAWTPALNGGLTPNIYQASFTVIGNRVFLTCNITVPTNSINAAIIVSGLPYSTLHDGSGALSYTNAQTTNDFFILVQGSQIYFYKGIGTTNYLLSDLSGYILRFTAQYNINN
jgi:hypothetical protein